MRAHKVLFRPLFNPAKLLSAQEMRSPQITIVIPMDRSRMKPVHLVLFIAAVALSAEANAADARKGGIIAERWCSGCHVVSPRQKQGSTEAPPFSEIADRENLDPGKVALFLLLPHPPMSGINLSRNDAADLAAYIDSQKGQ